MKNERKELIEKLNESVDKEITICARKDHVMKTIVNGLQRVKSHKNYTKRVLDAVRAQLEVEFVGKFPLDGLVVTSSGYGDQNLRVWGIAGLTYDEHIYLSWNLPKTWESEESRGLSWYDRVMEQVNRYDFEKRAASFRAFKDTIPALVDLEIQIDALKAKAGKLNPGFSLVKNILKNV